MNRCVILSAGPIADADALRTWLQPDDVFIAADGGYCLADFLGVKPIAVVADFDSSRDKNVPADTEIIRLPVCKNVTDTAAAVDYARCRGYRDFLLLGCTGGRLDHQYAAMQLLVQLAQDGCRAVMANESNYIMVATTSPVVLQPMDGWSLSLFAFGGDVNGLSIVDAAYELESYTLSSTDSLCVSNAVGDSPCTVSFNSGTLLVYRSRD